MSAPSDNPDARIRSVLHPVGDIAAAVDFHGTMFGFTPRFVDGVRYAALDAGDTTLALAGAEEDITRWSSTRHASPLPPGCRTPFELSDDVASSSNPLCRELPQ